VLLDLHPEPEYPELWVRTDDGVTTVGKLDTSINIGKVHAARDALTSVIETGYFTREDVKSFEFHYYFSDVDVWLEYMAGHWTDAAINPTIPTRARALLRRPTDRLLIRERVHAARLIAKPRPPLLL
jgi:hypothetical protein